MSDFDSAVRDFRDCEDKLMTARSELAKARRERDEFGATLAAIRDALGCEPGDEVEAVRAMAFSIKCARGDAGSDGHRQVFQVSEGRVSGAVVLDGTRLPLWSMALEWQWDPESARRDRPYVPEAAWAIVDALLREGWQPPEGLNSGPDRRRLGDAERMLLAVRARLSEDFTGCEAGQEAERIAQVMAERDAAQSMLTPTPAPGDTLNPADFGEGEAGVLRLAALLSEAPVGAVVRTAEVPARDGRTVAPVALGRGVGWPGPPKVMRGPWDAKGGVHAWTHMQAAERAPLTVVAWPS